MIVKGTPLPMPMVGHKNGAVFADQPEQRWFTKMTNLVLASNLQDGDTVLLGPSGMALEMGLAT